MEDGDIFVSINQTSMIALRVYDNDGTPLAAYIVLTIVIDGKEYSLASNYSTATGEFMVEVFIPIDWRVGQRDVIIAASIGDYYIQYKDTRVMFIRNPVELTLINGDQLEFIWSVGITINIQAFNPFGGTYIGGLQIIVVLVLNENADNNPFELGLTDSNGRLTLENIFKDAGINGLDVDFRITITVVENMEFQNSQIVLNSLFDFSIVPLEVDGVYELEDNGMTQNQIITFTFESDFGEVDLNELLRINPQLYRFRFSLYYQGTDRNEFISQGNLDIDGEFNTFTFVIDQMGKWELVITTNIPLINIRGDEFVIFAGWNRTTVNFNWEDGETVEVVYGTEQLDVTLLPNDGNPIAGLNVIVNTPFGDDLYTTDENGMFALNIDPDI